MQEGNVISRKRATKNGSFAHARISDEHPAKVLRGRLAKVNTSKPGTNHEGSYFHCETIDGKRLLTAIHEKFLIF